MNHYHNPLMAGTGALVLAGVLSLEGVPARGQDYALLEKETAPFGEVAKVTVAGMPMALYTEVWDDPGSADTLTVLRVMAGGEKFPAELTVEKVWFVNGGRRMEASVLPEEVSAPVNEQIRWAEGVADPDGDGEVDLIVQLRDRKGARHVLTAIAEPVRNLP